MTASIGWLATMLIVIVGWVLFRSPNLHAAGQCLGQMAALSSGIAWYPPLVLGALGCLVAEHLAWRTRLRRAMRLPWSAWYSPIATAIMMWALLIYAPQGFRPFVYFQF
jgi:alginate O-acetyltransferase complex protein AlgI